MASHIEGLAVDEVGVLQQVLTPLRDVVAEQGVEQLGGFGGGLGVVVGATRRHLEHEMVWSRRRWGRRHRLAFRAGLQARLDAIAANPAAHPLRRDLGTEVRLARHGRLLIAYLVDAPALRVVVVAFVNVRRELGTSLAAALDAFEEPDAIGRAASVRRG